MRKPVTIEGKRNNGSGCDFKLSCKIGENKIMFIMRFCHLTAEPNNYRMISSYFGYVELSDNLYRYHSVFLNWVNGKWYLVGLNKKEWNYLVKLYY